MKINKSEITKHRPCKEAIEFRGKYNSFEDAWNDCPRGGWMLWIAQRVGVDIKLLTKAKALCANTVRHLMKDERSINAIDVALKFADGRAADEELRIAASDAYNASTEAAGAAVVDAAYAAFAAAAVAVDAYATAVYAYSAYAKAADSYAVAADANKINTANICREVLTDEVFKLIKRTKK